MTAKKGRSIHHLLFLIFLPSYLLTFCRSACPGVVTPWRDEAGLQVAGCWLLVENKKHRKATFCRLTRNEQPATSNGFL
jgi:hypothetical protein